MQRAFCQSNVVVIVSDDTGWADFGFMRDAAPSADPQNMGEVPTPNLDALATAGVTFTNAYSATLCSHSRAMIVTGQYTTRIGYTWFSLGQSTEPIDQNSIVQGLPVEAETIWERMQDIGYETAAVGKWHLGSHSSAAATLGNRPEYQGVEHFQGLWSGGRSYRAGVEAAPEAQLRETVSDGAGNIATDTVIENNYVGQYVTDVFGDQSAEYIKSKAGGSDPFFLYTAFTATHHPMQATASDLAFIDSLNEPAFTGDRRTYAAMQYSFDRNVGKIIEALEDPAGDGTSPGNDSDNILDETLIVFINDNGGNCCFASANSASNGTLRAGKGHQFEGGIRVPMIIAGAGIDSDQLGTVSTDLVHSIDILPTVVVGAGGGSIGPSEVIDGKNLLPYINETVSGEAHEHLFVPVYQGNRSAVRFGKWKFMYQQGTGYLLYDLDSDIREQFNRINDPSLVSIVEQGRQIMASHHVQTEKSRHDFQAFSTHQFDHFRFRDDSFTDATFSTLGAWVDAQTGNPSFSASWRDGYANNQLTFRASTTNDYAITNDLVSFGGFGYMLNKLNLVNASNVLAMEHTATIDGLPLMFTNRLEGDVPEFNLDAFDATAGRFSFNLDLDIEIYDDLLIQGDGNQNFTINGQLREFRSGRSITKTGSSNLTLAGGVEITGAFDLQDGELSLTNGSFRGDLSARGGTKIIVGGKGFNELPGPLPTTLTIDGDYFQAVEATLELDLLDGSTHDSVNVLGAATIAGTLDVKDLVGFVPSAATSFQIFSASGGLSGEFDTVNLPEQDGYNWQISYTATSVLLSMGLVGDFDGDGDRDGLDFLAWQRTPDVGSLSEWQDNLPSGLTGDFDGDGDRDGLDFLTWQRADNVGSLSEWEDNYGLLSTSATATIPEPAALALALTVLCLVNTRRL